MPQVCRHVAIQGVRIFHQVYIYMCDRLLTMMLFFVWAINGDWDSSLSKVSLLYACSRNMYLKSYINSLLRGGCNSFWGKKRVFPHNVSVWHLIENCSTHCLCSQVLEIEFDKNRQLMASMCAWKSMYVAMNTYIAHT